MVPFPIQSVAGLWHIGICTRHALPSLGALVPQTKIVRKKLKKCGATSPRGAVCTLWEGHDRVPDEAGKVKPHEGKLTIRWWQ